MTYPFSGIIVRFESASTLQEGTRQEETSANEADKEHDADLHVNLWDLHASHYLDIGVMVRRRSPYPDKVVIDLPWDVRRDCIIDLGSKLDSEKLLTAVFNESVSYESDSTKNTALVKLGGNNSSSEFNLLRVGVNRLELEPIIAGDYTLTRVKIPISAFFKVDGSNKKECLPVYVRLRFRDVPRSVFFTEFHPKDRNLLSSSVVTHLLDLRVNVRRGVPDEVLLSDSTIVFPEISKIHVFVIVPRDTELPFQSENYKGCRSLEDEAIWYHYLGLSEGKKRQIETVKGYLGYQWSVKSKGEKPVKDLVALGRFVRTTSTVLKSYKFVFLMLWLGTVGSALWSVISESIRKTDDFFGFAKQLGNEFSSYSLGLWVGFAMIPIVIIHVDIQSVRNALGSAKKALSKMLSKVQRWWRGI